METNATLPDRIGRKRRKIFDNDVTLIRRAVAEGERVADVAARFKISKEYVSKLTSDANWARVSRAAHDLFDLLERADAVADYYDLAELLGADPQEPGNLAERIYAFLEFEQRARESGSHLGEE